MRARPPPGLDRAKLQGFRDLSRADVAGLRAPRLTLDPLGVQPGTFGPY
jgi:hypothetical protein